MIKIEDYFIDQDLLKIDILRIFTKEYSYMLNLKTVFSDLTNISTSWSLGQEYAAYIKFKDGIRIIDIMTLPFKNIATENINIESFYRIIIPSFLANYFFMYLKDSSIYNDLYKESYLAIIPDQLTSSINLSMNKTRPKERYCFKGNVNENYLNIARIE